MIFYFFRLLQFPQSNFPLVGAYYLSRSCDVKCFINHFAPSTCRTASVSSQKRFIDSQQIGMGIEKFLVKHASGGWVTTRPAQLAELCRSEFDPELFSHSAYDKFFVTVATIVPYLTFCDKMRKFSI